MSWLTLYVYDYDTWGHLAFVSYHILYPILLSALCTMSMTNRSFIAVRAGLASSLIWDIYNAATTLSLKNICKTISTLQYYQYFYIKIQLYVLSCLLTSWLKLDVITLLGNRINTKTYFYVLFLIHNGTENKF